MLLLGIAITIWLLRRESKRQAREALLHKAHLQEQAKRDAEYQVIRARVRENHEIRRAINRRIPKATVVTPRKPVSVAPRRVGAIQTSPPVTSTPAPPASQPTDDSSALLLGMVIGAALSSNDRPSTSCSASTDNDPPFQSGGGGDFGGGGADSSWSDSSSSSSDSGSSSGSD